MKEDLFERLLHISREGTCKEREIAHYLLNKKNTRFEKISNLSNIFNTTNATISRFVKALGYNYFKDFVADWNNVWSSEKIYNIELKRKEYGKKIVNKIKKASSIWVISSSKCEGLALFFDNSLRQIKIKSKYINSDDFKNIKIKNSDLIIILSLSAYSLSISNALTEIARLKQKPMVNIISNSKWSGVFEKYENIDVFLIEKNELRIKNNLDYFHALVHLSKFIYYVAEYLFKDS